MGSPKRCSMQLLYEVYLFPLMIAVFSNMTISFINGFLKVDGVH